MHSALISTHRREAKAISSTSKQVSKLIITYIVDNGNHATQFVFRARSHVIATSYFVQRGPETRMQDVAQDGRAAETEDGPVRRELVVREDVDAVEVPDAAPVEQHRREEQHRAQRRIERPPSPRRR